MEIKNNMKKYFIFRYNGNIIIADVKNMYENKEGITIWKKNKITYFTKIEFGSFVKIISGITKRKSNELRYQVKPINDGGFILKDIEYDEEYEIKDMDIIFNPKEGYVMEFPDDTSAELWVEMMRHDYTTLLEKGWW